jgi:hypothetical protein
MAINQEILYKITGDATQFLNETGKADAGAKKLTATLRTATDEEKRIAVEAKATAEAMKRMDKAAFDTKVKLEQARLEQEKFKGAVMSTTQAVGKMGAGILAAAGWIGAAFRGAAELYQVFMKIDKLIGGPASTFKRMAEDAERTEAAMRGVAEALRFDRAMRGVRFGAKVADITARRLGNVGGAMVSAVGTRTDIGGNMGGSLLGGLGDNYNTGLSDVLTGAAGAGAGNQNLAARRAGKAQRTNILGLPQLFNAVNQNTPSGLSLLQGGLTSAAQGVGNFVRDRGDAGAGGAAGMFGAAGTGGMGGDLASRAQQVEEFSKKIADSSSIAGGAFQSLSSGLAAAVEAAISGGDSIGKAFLKAAAAQLKATAVQSSVLALFETAKGFAALAVGSPTAAAHFKSAAVFGATALAAGVVGAGLGAAGGGGASSPQTSGSGSSTANIAGRSNSSGSGGLTVIVNVSGVVGDAASVGAQINKAIDTGLRSGTTRDRLQKTVRFG